jgi:hypothetical protein
MSSLTLLESDPAMTAEPKFFSKTSLALSLVVLLLSSSAAVGQLVNLRLMSSAYGWKQYDTVGTSKKLWRGFQSVMLDVGQGDFSLHGHFQGAVMLQKHLDELPDYRLFYGYAQWKNIAKVADLSLGRLPFFVGVGSGTIDGALTRFHFASNMLAMTFYGGANTPLDLTVKKWGPLKRDFTLGGQILLSVKDFRLGASYMNRQRQRPGYWTVRPDTLFNPSNVYVDPEQAREQYAGGDLSYSLPKGSFYTRYDYNVDYKQTQRAQIGLHYYPTDEWAVSADYIHRAPRLPFNSFFAVFSVPTSEELEAGVDYTFVSSTRLFVRGAAVKYVDDQSFRYTVGVANDYASASYRGGTGYAGELNAVSVQGSCPLLDRKLIPTLGVSYTSYKLNVSDKTENTIATALGLIARPLQMLSVDVQGQWLSNKVYKNDVRLYAGLNFWISHNLNLFE